MPNGPPGFTGYSITAGRRLRCGLLSVCARALPILGLLGIYGGAVASATTPTLTTLSVTANGLPVANIQPDTVITLTASVAAGGKAVSPGTINFCDASAAYCTDIHQIGTAQLTSSGTATYKFRPGPGTHSYKAVFVGTNSYSASSSTPASLTVSGNSVMFMSATGLPGNYTLTVGIPGTPSADPSGKVNIFDTTANVLLGSPTLVPDPTAPGFIGTNPPTGKAPNCIIWGDFNGDGIPDLVISDYGYGIQSVTITVLLGNGDGTFRQGVGLSVAPYEINDGNDIVVGDFNNDGKLDIAVATQADLIGSPIAIFLGNGDGTFNTIFSVLDGPGAGGIAVGDFNNDGNLDLAIGNVAPTISAVTILLGNGDGTFSAVAAQPKAAGQPVAITSGDFNGDGKTDLAVGTDINGIYILLGNGDGTFAPAPPLNSPLLIGGILIADFNGDGVLDLAAAFDNFSTGSSQTIEVYLGNGDGTFTQSPTPLINGKTGSLAVGDLNGDGIPDLALPYDMNGSNVVVILLGNGDGTFKQSGISPATGAGPVSIVATDLNGDGSADIAVANYSDNDVTVLLTLAGPSSIATLTGVSVTGPGIHYAQGLYPGDANFPASASNLVPLLAALTPTTSVLTVTPTSTTYGSTVTLSAVVRPTTPPGYGAPTGSVTFYDGSTVIGTSFIQNGSAVLTLTTLPAGTDGLTCTYNGDNVYAVSQCNTVPIVVGAATTTLTLTSSLNPAPPLTRVTFTATLTNGTVSAGTGQAITLTLNGQTINLTTNSSGVASYSIGTLTPGSYPVTATFAGSNTLLASSAMLTEVVISATAKISVAASPNPVFLLNPTTLTATVASSYATPMGTVTFLDGTNPIGTGALSSAATGVASAALSTSTLTLGTHSITASYSGDNNFAPGTSPAVLVVVEDFTLTIPNSPVTIPHGGTAVFNLHVDAVGAPGMASAITFSLSGNPDHSTVTFAPATIPTGSGNVSGTLTIATPDYPVGPWSRVTTPHSSRNTMFALLAFGTLLLPLTRRRSRLKIHRLSCLLFLIAASILLATSTGCGSGWPAQGYTVQVTATSGNLSRTATARLISQ